MQVSIKLSEQAKSVFHKLGTVQFLNKNGLKSLPKTWKKNIPTYIYIYRFRKTSGKVCSKNFHVLKILKNKNETQKKQSKNSSYYKLIKVNLIYYFFIYKLHAKIKIFC